MGPNGTYEMKKPGGFSVRETAAMAPLRGFFYLKKQQNRARANFFFNLTLFLHGFIGVTNRTRFLKNPTWRHIGRSSEQNETANMPIELIDFCQPGQTGSKM